jgi:hypothetical protein
MAEDNIINDPTKQGESPVSNNPLDKSFDIPNIQTYDLIDAMNNGIAPFDLQRELRENEIVSVRPVSYYAEKNPALANNPDFLKYHDQARQMSMAINSERWKNVSQTSANLNTFPGLDVPGFSVKANMQYSSRVSTQGEMYATPQEWAVASGKYVEYNPNTGLDEIKEMSWWDRNSSKFSILAYAGIPLTIGKFIYDIVDGENFVYDYDQQGNSYIRKVKSIDDLDGKEILSMWGPQKLYDSDWYDFLAGFMTEAIPKLVRSPFTLIKSIKDFGQGVYAGITTDTEAEKQAKLQEYRTEGISAGIDKFLNTAINRFTAMTYSPSVKLQSEGWFGSADGFTYQLSTGLGQLAGQIAATMALGGTNAFASLTGRFGANAIRSTAQTAAKNEFAAIAKSAFKKMGGAAQRYTMVGTAVALDDVYRTARVTGLRREDAGIITAMSAPFVYTTERLISAGYFGKMFEGDDELVRRGFRQIMKNAYENVMKSGVKVGSKEFVNATQQEVKKGLLGGLKKFAKDNSGKFTGSAFADAGRKMFEIGVQAPLREGIQEGLEETGYIGVEHVWDHYLGKWMNDDARYGTEFYSAKSAERVEENFIAGFMIGMAGAGIGHVSKSTIRRINRNKPGVVDAKNNALEAAILNGQKEEIIERGKKLWKKGLMNSPDKNTAGDLIELGTEGSQQAGMTVDHNRYEKYGMKEGYKLTTLNDLAYYNFLETLESKETELFGIYNEIRNRVENMDAFNEMMNTPGADVRLRQRVNELRDEQDDLREDLYSYNEIKETQGEDKEIERKLEERKEALRIKRNAFDREFIMSANKADMQEKQELLGELNDRKNNGENVDAEISMLTQQIDELSKDNVTARSKYSRNYLDTIKTGVYNKLGSTKRNFVPKNIDEIRGLEDHIINTGQQIKATAKKTIAERKRAREQFISDATSALNESIKMLDVYRNTNVTSLQEDKDGKKNVVSKQELRQQLGGVLSQLDQIITGSGINVSTVAELKDSQRTLRSMLSEEMDKTIDLMGGDEMAVEDYINENPNDENAHYYKEILNKYYNIGGESVDEVQEESKEDNQSKMTDEEKAREDASKKKIDELNEFSTEVVNAIFREVLDLVLQLPPIDSDNINKDVHGPIIRKAIELIEGVEGLDGNKEKYGIKDFIDNLSMFQKLNDESPIDNITKVRSQSASSFAAVFNVYENDPGAFLELENGGFVGIIRAEIDNQLNILQQYASKSGLGIKLKFERDLYSRNVSLANKISAISFSINDDHTIISPEAKKLYYEFVEAFGKWSEKVSRMTREEYVANLEAISAQMVEFELKSMKFESQMYKEFSGKENRNKRISLLNSMHNQVENQLPKNFRGYARGYIANAENLTLKNTLFQKRPIEDWIDFLKTGYVTEEFSTFLKENGFYDVDEVGMPISTELVNGILVAIDTFLTNYVNEISTKDSEGFYAFLKTHFNELYAESNGNGFRPNIAQEEALKTIYAYLSQTTEDGFVYMGRYGLDSAGNKTADSFDRYSRSLLISGYGGTGKTMMVTSTVLSIIDSFEANNTGARKKMVIITPSKSLAAGVFKKEINKYNYDIEVIEHSEFFNKIESSANYWNTLAESNDYIVIDEASRITREQIAAIRASKPGSKIILTGDHYQSSYAEDREYDTAAMSASDMIHTVELTEIHRSGVEYIHNVIDAVVASMVGLRTNPIEFPKTYYTQNHKLGVRYVKTTNNVEETWLNDIKDESEGGKGLDGREIIFATSGEAEAFSRRHSLTDAQKANIRYVVNTEGATANGSLINPISVQGLSVTYAYVAISQGTTMTERKDFNTGIGRAKKFLLMPGSTIEELSDYDDTGSKIIDYSDASNISLQQSLDKANAEFNELGRVRMDTLGSGSMDALNELIKKYQSATQNNTPEGGTETNPNNADEVIESNEVFNARKTIKAARANNNSAEIINTLLSVQTPKLINEVDNRRYERNVNGRIETYVSVSDTITKLFQNTSPFNEIRWGEGNIRNTEHGNIIDKASTYALLRYYQDKLDNDTSDTPEAIENRKTLRGIIEHIKQSEQADTTDSLFENGVLLSEAKYKARFKSETFHFTKEDDVATYNANTYNLIKSKIEELAKQYDYVIPQYVVFDEANKIAGSLDFVGVKNGTFGIVDVKSKRYGASGIKIGENQQNEISESGELEDIQYTDNGRQWPNYAVKDFLQQQVYSRMLSNLGADTGTTTLNLMIFKPFDWNGHTYNNIGRNGKNVFQAKYVGSANIKYQNAFVDQMFPMKAKEPDVNTQTQQGTTPGSMVNNGPFSSGNNGVTIKDLQVGDVVVMPNGDENEVIADNNGTISVVGTAPFENETEISGNNTNFTKGVIVDTGHKSYQPIRSATLYRKHQVLPMTMISITSDFMFKDDPSTITAEMFWNKVKEMEYFTKRNRILEQASDLVISYEPVTIWAIQDDGKYRKESITAAIIRRDGTTGTNGILGALALPKYISSSKLTQVDIAKQVEYTENDFQEYTDEKERKEQVEYNNALLKMHKEIINGKKTVKVNSIVERVPVVKYSKFQDAKVKPLSQFISDPGFNENYEFLNKAKGKASSVDDIHPYFEPATATSHARYYVLARAKNGAPGTEFQIDLAYSGITTSEGRKEIETKLRKSFLETIEFVKKANNDSSVIAKHIASAYWYQLLKQNIALIATKENGKYVSTYPKLVEIKYGMGKLFSINTINFKKANNQDKIEGYSKLLDAIINKMNTGDIGTIYPPFSYSRNADFIASMSTRAIEVRSGAPSISIEDYKDNTQTIGVRKGFSRKQQNLLESVSVPTTLVSDVNEYMSKVMGVAWDSENGWFVKPQFKDGKQVLGYFLDGVRLWDASGGKPSIHVPLTKNFAERHEVVHWMFSILDEPSRIAAYKQAKRHMLANFKEKGDDGRFMNVDYSKGVDGISDFEAEEWIAEVNRGKQQYNEKIKNGTWLHRFVNWFRGLFNISKIHDIVEQLLMDLNAGKFADRQSVRNNGEPKYLAETTEFDATDSIDKIRVEKKLNGQRNVIFAMNYITQLFYQNSRFNRFIDEIDNDMAQRTDAESWRRIYVDHIQQYTSDPTLSVEGLDTSDYSLNTNYAREMIGEPKDIMIDRRAKNFIKKTLAHDRELFNDIVSMIVPDYDFNDDNYNVETRDTIEHGQINTNVTISRLAKMFLRTIPAFKWVRNKNGYHIVNLKQNIDGQIIDFENPENFATNSHQVIDYSEMEGNMGRYVTEFRSSSFYNNGDMFTDFINFLADKVNQLTIAYKNDDDVNGDYYNGEVNRILSFIYVFNATPLSFMESGINLYMTDLETGSSEMIDFNDAVTPMRSYSQMLNPFMVMQASGEMNGVVVTESDIADIRQGKDISPEKKEMYDFALAKAKASATIINAFSAYFFSITERDMTSTMRNKYKGGDKRGEVYYSVRVSAQNEATAIKDQWIAEIQNKVKELFMLDGADVFDENMNVKTELSQLINDAVDDVLNFRNSKMKLNVNASGGIDISFDKKVILTGRLAQYTTSTGESKSRLEFSIPNIPNPNLPLGLISLMNSIGLNKVSVYAIKDILRTTDDVIKSKNDYKGVFGRQHLAHLLGMLYSTVLVRSDKLNGVAKRQYLDSMNEWLSGRTTEFERIPEEDELERIMYVLEEARENLDLATINKMENEIEVLTKMVQSMKAPKPDMFYEEILAFAKRIHSDFDSPQRKGMLTSADRTRYHRFGFASHVDSVLPVTSENDPVSDAFRRNTNAIISTTNSALSPYRASDELNKATNAHTNNNILNGNIVIQSHALATGLTDEHFGKGTDVETSREFIKDMIFGHFRDSVMKLRPLALTPNRPGDKRQQRLMNVTLMSNGVKLYNIQKVAKTITGVTIREDVLNDLVYTQVESYMRRGLMSLAKLLSVQDVDLGFTINNYFKTKYEGNSPFANIGSYSSNLAILEDMLSRGAIHEINAVQVTIENYYEEIYNAFLAKEIGNSRQPNEQAEKLAKKKLSAVLSGAQSDGEFMGLNSQYDYVVKKGFWLGNASGFRDKTYGLNENTINFIQNYKNGDVEQAAKFRDQMYLGQWGNLTSAIKNEGIFINDEIIKMLPGATGNQLTIRKEDDEEGNPVFEWNPFMKLYMYSKDLFARSYADVMYGPTSQFEDLNMLSNRSKHVESIGTHAITSTAIRNPFILPTTTRQIRLYDVFRNGMTSSPEDSQVRLLGLYHRFLVNSFGGETGIASTNQHAMKTASFGMNYQYGLGENEKSLESVYTADDYFNSSVGRFRIELMLNGRAGNITTIHSENARVNEMYSKALEEWNLFGFFEGRIQHYINEIIDAKIQEYDQAIEAIESDYMKKRAEIEDKYRIDLGSNEEIMQSKQEFLIELKALIKDGADYHKKKERMEQERSNGGMMIVSTNSNEIYTKAEDDLYNHVVSIRMMGGPVDPMMAIIGKIVPSTASKINDSMTNGHNLYNPQTYTNPERPIITVNHRNADQVLILNPNSDKDMVSRGSQFDYQITLGGEHNIRRAMEVYDNRNIIAKSMERELRDRVIQIEEDYGITDEKKAYITHAAKMIIRDCNNIPNGDMLAKVLIADKISYSDPVVQSRIIGQLMKNYNAMIKQKTSGYSYSQRADFTEYYDIKVRYEGQETDTIITLTRSELFGGSYDEVLTALGHNPNDLRNTLMPRLSKRMKFLDVNGNDVAKDRRFNECVTIRAAELKMPYKIFEKYDYNRNTLAYHNRDFRKSTLIEMLTIEILKEDGTPGYLNVRSFVEEHNNGENYYKSRTAGLNALSEYLKSQNISKSFVDDYVEPLLNDLLMVGFRVPYTGPASGQVYEVGSFNYQSDSIADISPEKNDYDNSDQDADKLTFIANPKIENDIANYERKIRSIYMDYYSDSRNSELINTAISADAIYDMNANDARSQMNRQRFGIANEAEVNYNAQQHKQMVGPSAIFMKRYAFIMTLSDDIRKKFIKYDIDKNDIAVRGTQKWIDEHREELEDEYYPDGNMRASAMLRRIGGRISSNMNMLTQMFLDGEKRPNAQYLNINTSNIGIAFAMAMMGYTIPDIKKALNTTTAKKITNKVVRGTELGAVTKYIYEEAEKYYTYMTNLNNPKKIKALLEYRKGRYEYLIGIYRTMLKAHGITDEYINARYEFNGVSDLSLSELETLANYDPRVNSDEGVKEWSDEFTDKITKEVVHMEQYLNNEAYANEMDQEYIAEINAKKEEAGQFFYFAEASESFGLLDIIVNLDQTQKTRPDEILPMLERLRYVLGVELENAIIGEGENIQAPAGKETWREIAIEKSNMGGEDNYFVATNQETVDNTMTDIISGVQEALKGKVVIRGIMTDLNSGVSEGAARAGLNNNIPVLGFYSNRSGYNDAFGNYARGAAFINRKIVKDLVSEAHPESNIISVSNSEMATENEVESSIVEKISSLVGQNDIAIIFDHGQGSLYRTKYHANEFKGRLIHINLNNYMSDGVLNQKRMNEVIAEKIKVLVSNVAGGLQATNTGVKLYITGSTLLNFANKKESEREAYISKMEAIHSKVNTLGLINNVPFIRDNFKRLINDVVKYISQTYPIRSADARRVIVQALNKVGKSSYSSKRTYAAITQAFNAVVYSFALKELPGANSVKIVVNGTDYNFNLGDYYDHHPFMMAFSKYIDTIRTDSQYNTNVFMKYLRTDDKGFVVLDFSEKSDITRQIMREHFNNLPDYITPAGDTINVRQLFEFYNIIRFGFDYKAGSITDYVFSVHEKIKPTLDKITDDLNGNESFSDFRNYFDTLFADNAVVSYLRPLIPVAMETTVLKDDEIGEEEVVIFGRDSEYKRSWIEHDNVIGRNKREEVIYQSTSEGSKEVYPIYHHATQTIPLFKAVTSAKNLSLDSINTYRRMIEATQAKDRTFTTRFIGQTSFKEGEIVNIYGNEFVVKRVSPNKLDVTFGFSKSLKQNCQ